MVDAFRTGAYGAGTFSGEYGDLAATLSAILLDREARSPTLDYDATHGQLREPLLKVIHFLRSMEYSPRGGREVILHGLDAQIGQQVRGRTVILHGHALCL